MRDVNVISCRALLLIAAIVSIACGAEARAQAPCTDCHEEQKAYAESVHKNLACFDCHVGFKEFPHQEQPSNQQSTISRSNIVGMCERCHGDLKFVEDNRIPGRVLPVINYKQSVHGKAVSGGQLGAALCTDCHGSHKILAPTDVRSMVSRSNAPSTCGTCHKSEFSQYERSVHGKAHAQGKSGVPTCTDCHGIHSILHPGDARASDAEKALGKTSCSRCHESEVLSREYSLPVDRVTSYLDSYHGLAVKRGSVAVANCASCHGVHEILASTDRASSIHVSNLPQTCGKCHPGASANFARGTVHQSSGNGQAVMRWVSVFYVGLIVVVIGAMLLHNVFDFRMKMRAGSIEQAEQLFSRGDVAQHGILMTCFVVLVVTGFALKWPDSAFGYLVPAGEQFRRWIHRGAGAALIVLAVFHILYLICTSRGRMFISKFWPHVKDLSLAVGNVSFITGLRRDRPGLESPSYIEKIEYWALLWGIAIMAGTGVLLWFENLTMRLMPLWVLNLFTAVHFYEAVLATLAILVWHIYFVVLDPTVYPLKSAKRLRSAKR
jgi:cytochrome b subunit of formate dehydrogenase